MEQPDLRTVFGEHLAFVICIRYFVGSRTISHVSVSLIKKYDQILRLLNQCNDYQLQVILATTVALLNSDTSDVDTTNDTKQNLLNPDN